MRIAKGLAAFRIFVGLVWLGNALAKVVNQSSYDLGVVSFGLISRDTARGLLESYTGPESNAITPLKSLYRDLVLANWGFFQWLLTAAELVVLPLFGGGIAGTALGFDEVTLHAPLAAAALAYGAVLVRLDRGDFQRLAEAQQRLAAERGLGSVVEADGHDLQPLDVRAERDARRARLDRLELRLVVRETLGEERDAAPPEQKAAAGFERAQVLRNVLARVNAPVERQRLDRA
jgi:hypothetical protein